MDLNAKDKTQHPENVELLSAQKPITDFKGLLTTIISAVVCFGIYYILPYSTDANKGIALLLFVAALWFTEAVHITVTALMIPILAVVLGFPDMDIKKAMAGFSDPTIYIFFGGFALATALHMQRLDRKIAVSLLRLSRGNMKVAVLMLFAVTAFLSMWISNTATAAMMLPLAMGMMSHLDQEKERKTYVFVLLGIAYCASIGGLGTVVGSPPNMIAAKALIDECINEWTEGSRTELKTLINAAFQVDKEGNISTARVLGLRRLQITDEKWQRAMDALSDSLQVHISKPFVRVYRRGEDGEYQLMNLDVAKV